MKTEVLSDLVQKYLFQVYTVTNGPFSIISQPQLSIFVPDVLVIYPVLISFKPFKNSFNYLYNFEMLDDIFAFPLFSFSINIFLNYISFAFSESIPSISVKFYFIYSFQFLLEDLLLK
jgi:hypothetical protein